MTPYEWATFAIAIIMFLCGWITGSQFGTKMFYRKRNVGTIVYVDKEEEAVTIQFNSENAVHKMKDLDYVVFTIESLE